MSPPGAVVDAGTENVWLVLHPSSVHSSWRSTTNWSGSNTTELASSSTTQHPWGGAKSTRTRPAPGSLVPSGDPGLWELAARAQQPSSFGSAVTPLARMLLDTGLIATCDA